MSDDDFHEHHLDPVVRTPSTVGIPEESEPRVDSGVLGTGVSCVLGIVAFVLVISLLAPPYPEDEILRAKLEQFLRHADEYDGVFLGSSRVYRAFDPTEFERRTEESLRIFNFGLPYGRPHELDHLVEVLLRRRPVKYVFVEVMDWSPSLNADLEDQDRTIRWHSARETRSAIRTAWLSDGSTWRRIWTVAKHVGHFLKRCTNFGGGPLVVRSWFDTGERHRQWMGVVRGADGFVRYEQETDARYARERRGFLENDLEDFRRRVARVDAENRGEGSLRHFNTRALAEQEALIRRLGAEPIYVVPNLRRGTPGWHRLDDLGVVETLFSFNHVERYPELYALENRFDRRHLNTAGAAWFTRYLAERFDSWRERER